MLKNKQNLKRLLFEILVGAMLIVLLGSVLYFATIEYWNEETIEIIIKDKYVKRNDNNDIYLVVSEDSDTYKITDLFWKGKFNSTDLYNQLEIGNTYKITVTGVRLHFFSMYRNINKIEKIN